MNVVIAIFHLGGAATVFGPGRLNHTYCGTKEDDPEGVQMYMGTYMLTHSFRKDQMRRSK